MSEFYEPAYPIIDSDADGFTVIAAGLTIRQKAVLMMARGLLEHNGSPYDDELFARAACRLADAVLRAERESRSE